MISRNVEEEENGCPVYRTGQKDLRVDRLLRKETKRGDIPPTSVHLGNYLSQREDPKRVNVKCGGRGTKHGQRVNDPPVPSETSSPSTDTETYQGDFLTTFPTAHP